MIAPSQLKQGYPKSRRDEQICPSVWAGKYGSPLEQQKKNPQSRKIHPNNVKVVILSIYKEKFYNSSLLIVAQSNNTLHSTAATREKYKHVYPRHEIFTVHQSKILCTNDCSIGECKRQVFMNRNVAHWCIRQIKEEFD